MGKLKNQGFTLIELILVVTLIGIIGTFAIPNMIFIADKLILNSTAKMMASDIRLAQSKAVKECRVYHFEINTDKLYYYIRSDPNSGSNAQSKRVDINPRITYIYSTLPNKGYEYYRILSFSRKSSPSSGGTIILYTKYNSIKLTIEVTTGRVRIFSET